MKLFLALFLLLATPALAWNEPAESNLQYKLVSSTTVSTVKSGSGFLHAITINGGSSSGIDIYDGGSIYANALMYSFSATNTAQTFLLDVNFTSGCVVYTNGALRYTVSYK